MWFHLNLDGIELCFRVAKYRKSAPEKSDEQWCNIDLALHGNNWLNYKVSSDILLACEVEEIRNRIFDLLEDKIQAEEELDFIEPDLTFVLYPKKDLREDIKYTYIAPGHEILDINADLRVHLWNDGLTANYLSLCFDRDDLQKLLIYLQLVTDEISKDDKIVQKLIESDIIRLY